MAPIPPTCRTRSRSCPPTAARSGQPSGSGPGPGTDRGRASSGAAPPHPIDVRLPGLSTQLSARLAATRRAGSSWVDRAVGRSRGALVTLVIGHKGAAGLAPENSLAAVRAARDVGADGVELDVRRTAGGAFAVHHDAALADGRRLLDLEASGLPQGIATLGPALDP